MRSSQIVQNSDKTYFIQEEREKNISSSPVSAFFHNFFKIGTVISYFLIPLFTKSTILSYILVIVCSAFDFWVVKNISGRFLVGLRWWSEYNEQEEEVWMFECRSDEKSTKPIDSRLFWTTQIGFTIFWGVWLGFHIVSLKFLKTISIFIAFILLALNLYAFFKCSKGLK